MFGRMAKMLLVLSAVAPVGLVYAWVAFNEGNRSVALWLIGGCIFLVFCCVYLFNKAHSVLERFPFQMSSVEAADRETIAFMLLYLSPLFTAKFGQLNMTLLLPTLRIFTLLNAPGYKYPFNLLLRLHGWLFYKIYYA